MAINSNSLSENALAGWAWHFGMPGESFSKWEDKLILELEVQGTNHNIRRLEETPYRTMSINDIKKKLKTASAAQIDAVIEALS